MKINWKMIVGWLLIFGSLSELFEQTNAYGIAGCLTMAAVGIYLVMKGRQKKKVY